MKASCLPLPVFALLVLSSFAFADGAGMSLGCNPGTKECVSGTEYHVCNEHAIWGPTASCLLGQHCAGGECTVPTPQCSQFQQTRCSPTDPNEVQICNSQYQWEDFKSCDYGCYAGYCKACQVGQRRCISTTDYQTCSYDGQWIGDATCGHNYYCDGGTCYLSPDAKCDSIGSYRCSPSDSKTLQKCGSNYQWGDYTHCSMGCLNSACRACAQGQSKCQDPMTVLYCIDGGQWGRQTTCPNGYYCTQGSCQIPAASQCSTIGQKRCSPTDHNTVQVCSGNYVFIDSVQCSQGCFDGRCAECKPGTTLCAGSTTYRICTQNGQLSDPKQCPAGYTCEHDGQCVATPQCADGDRTCVSNSIYSCKNGTWSLYLHCPSDTDCKEDTGTAYCAPEPQPSVQNHSSQQGGQSSSQQQSGQSSSQPIQPQADSTGLGPTGFIFFTTTVVLLGVVFYLYMRKKKE